MINSIISLLRHFCCTPASYVLWPAAARVHVMFVCQVRVVGTVGGVPIGSGQKLIFADQVYLILHGKRLMRESDGHKHPHTVPPEGLHEPIITRASPALYTTP